MRFFIPSLRPGAAAKSPTLMAKLFGKRSDTGSADTPERMGGLPYGLPEHLWPVCADCGKSQSLLAQFAHDPERLDLGRAGRMLFAFQCNHDPGMCDTWDQNSGANAAFILEPEALGNADTPAPADSPPLDPAAFIIAWEAQDDGLTPDQAAAFYSDATMNALGDDLLDAPRDGGTHLGGVPCWIQSADESPRPGWRFLGQLADFYGYPDDETVQGHNFGDMGIAYLFARDSEAGVPEVKMFWQCG